MELKKVLPEERETVIDAVLESKVIVILRGFTKEQLINTAAAMEKGGIRLMEVTFDQSKAVSDEETADLIRALATEFKGRMHVGAGTVMSVDQVELARRAGAEFIISPDMYEPVIRRTVELGMVSMPGVFTPTEAANAHRAGADFVKLFPNAEVKPSFIKNLAVPLSHIRFLAVGGVTAENMHEYLKAGAYGVGVASGIADKKAINAGDYGKITELARLYAEEAAKYSK